MWRTLVCVECGEATTRWIKNATQKWTCPDCSHKNVLLKEDEMAEETKKPETVDLEMEDSSNDEQEEESTETGEDADEPESEGADSGRDEPSKTKSTRGNTRETNTKNRKHKPSDPSKQRARKAEPVRDETSDYTESEERNDDDEDWFLHTFGDDDED